eukprot:SAG31_NODE_14975_length_777_cov_1.845133_1_plen_123_part_10
MSEAHMSVILSDLVVNLRMGAGLGWSMMPAAEIAMEKTSRDSPFVHQIMARLNATFNGISGFHYNDAATEIQAKYRGNRQRRLAGHEQTAARLIQRCWRGKADRSKFRSIRDAAEALQMEQAA